VLPVPVPGAFTGELADAELDVESAGLDGDEDDLGAVALAEAVLPDGHGVLDPVAALGPEGWLTGGALELIPPPGGTVALVLGDGDPLGGAELVGGGALISVPVGLGVVEPGAGLVLLAFGVGWQLAGVTVAPAGWWLPPEVG
jgi:hypothetical protein